MSLLLFVQPHKRERNSEAGPEPPRVLRGIPEFNFPGDAPVEQNAEMADFGRLLTRDIWMEPF